MSIFIDEWKGQGRSSDVLVEWVDQSITMNEVPSDVNTLLDGATYPRWKMSHFVAQKIFEYFWSVQNADGYLPGPVTPSADDGASLKPSPWFSPWE